MESITVLTLFIIILVIAILIAILRAVLRINHSVHQRDKIIKLLTSIEEKLEKS